MGEDDSNIRALRREWLAARVVGALAGVLLLTLGVLAFAGWWQGPHNAETPVPRAPSAAAPGEAKARHEESVAICTAALATAQQLGLVPDFATLDGGDTTPAGVQGRYACAAKTDAAKYALTFDLTCTNLSAGNCIALYSITQDGGTVIYRRS
jgi:hypothetical protein